MIGRFNNDHLEFPLARTAKRESVHVRAARHGAAVPACLTAPINFNDMPRREDEVVIDEVAVLFTDLKESSALYRRIGDAAAYRLVRKHFVFLTRIIHDHNGTVVKTIGDAVMAVFMQAGQAVKAAIAIQCCVNGFNRENGLSDGLVIKLGIHAGPAIAVKQGDRLDYFGSVVNIAAQLRSQSAGRDLVLSDETATDPSVVHLLTSAIVTPGQAMLKGFDQPKNFRRVTLTA